MEKKVTTLQVFDAMSAADEDIYMTREIAGFDTVGKGKNQQKVLQVIVPEELTQDIAHAAIRGTKPKFGFCFYWVNLEQFKAMEEKLKKAAATTQKAASLLIIALMLTIGVSANKRAPTREPAPPPPPSWWQVFLEIIRPKI